MPDVNVAVPFAAQETLFYCGPAVLQMALSALGVASPATPPSWQDQLWDLVQQHTGAKRPSSAPSTPTAPAFPTQKCERCYGQWSCWSSTPRVVEYLLNTLQTTAQYAVSTHGSEESATAVLLDALDGQVPGVALVMGWQHWLVVDGYRHSEPNGWAVAGRSVNGIYIRDPLDVPATHFVATAQWRADYLRFVACGEYQDTLVVIGGTRVPVPSAPAAPAAPTSLRIVDVVERSARYSGVRLMGPILSQREAMKRAAEGAAALSETSRLNPALQGAQPVDALLVQRLDHPDRYYYIVSFSIPVGVTARVIVDGFEGRLLEVSGVQERGQVFPPYVTPSAALERLHASADRDADMYAFKIRSGTVGQHPVAVWKPCGQSTSPFLPFYQLSVGDSFAYFRVDGTLFDALTEGPA